MKQKTYKNMEYTGNGKTEVLYYAKDKEGYGICVLNIRGSHPCGYITFPGIDKVETEEDFAPYREDDPFWEALVGPHGGYTFLGKLDNIESDDIWIGWDYAHLGDYVAYDGDINYARDERKWTTSDIINCALLQILYIKNGWFYIESEED